MKALVVYESMFGNTRHVADQIADGLGIRYDVTIVPVAKATPELVADADLLIVGGPTHVHGMASPRTRAAAKTMADKEGSRLVMQPDAVAFGVREWLETVPIKRGLLVAAFDTRAHGPAIFTGRASRKIARRLRHAGAKVVETKSFLVEKNAHLSSGEAELARAWGVIMAFEADQPLMTA
jgi:flavorubredoxin